MRTDTTTTKFHTPVQTSVLYKVMDDLLKDAYLLFHKSKLSNHLKPYDPFLINLKQLVSNHLKSLVQLKSGLTLKENNDLDTLQNFSDSLDQWKLKDQITYNQFPLNGSLAFDPARTTDDLNSTEASTLFTEIGLSKLGPASRMLLKTHYAGQSNFPEEITGEVQDRWDHRFKHLGALRRIYEELESDFLLQLLEASPCDLPVLFTCIELGELLLQKEYYAGRDWVLQDPEIPLLINFLPVLIKSIPKQGTHIGRFRILNRIGEGGFGIVYKGYDEKLRREVAIKMPRVSLDEKPEGKLQAIREARAVARLDHPGIVPLLDVVELPNQTILVSSFIQGNSLSNWLKNTSKPVPTKLAAQWVLEIAYAMIHAHSRGVLHCDLKPGNILLEIPENIYSDEFISPKVADFGLARLTGVASSTITGPGLGLGTPMNMAPEQTLGRDALTISCDIYGLGTILYQLLANAAPFKATTLGELLKEVLENAPTPLKTYRKDLHPDLEAICLKCMEKKPSLRYATMNDLALDLKKFLKGEPTVARPLGMITTSIRWIYNHSILVILLGIIISSLSTSTVVFMVLFQKMKAQAEENLIQKNLSDANAKRSVRDRQLADRQYYDSEMRAIQLAFEEGDSPKSANKLRLLVPEQFGGLELRDFEWYFWNRLTTQGHEKAIRFNDYAIRFAKRNNAQFAVSLQNSKSILIVDTPSGNKGKRFSGASEPAYNPDGTLLAYVDFENTVQWIDPDSEMNLGRFKNEGPVRRLLFINKETLLVLGEASWKLINVKTGDIVWDKEKERLGVFSNCCFITQEIFATWTNDGLIQVWDVKNKSKLDEFSCEGKLCQACEASADGKKLAWVSFPQKLMTRDLSSKTTRILTELKDILVFSLCWSPDGKKIATGGSEQAVVVFNSESGQILDKKTGHFYRHIKHVAFNDDEKLSSIGVQVSPHKAEFITWKNTKAINSKIIYKIPTIPLNFDVDSSGKIALIIDENKKGYLINLEDSFLIKEINFDNNNLNLTYNHHTKEFIVLSNNSTLAKIDLNGNILPLPVKVKEKNASNLLVSPKGDAIAISLFYGGVGVYSLLSGELLGNLPGEGLAPILLNIPMSDTFIASSRKEAAVVINWADCKLIKEYFPAPSQIDHLAISNNSNALAISKNYTTIDLVDHPKLNKARDFHTIEGSLLRGLNWSYNSERIFTWCLDGTINFFDSNNGQEVLKIKAHSNSVLNVIEVQKGKKFVSLGADKLLKLWDGSND